MAVTAKYGRKMDINVITFWMFVGNGVLSLIIVAVVRDPSALCLYGRRILSV